ncbi:MAG TPA: phosphoribosylglycinamide formyltransferase [Coxiellaceae bacterium]|nr:phosphoribosylglycinamide formyltransferase [Coxiellaceae bacterium]
MTKPLALVILISGNGRNLQAIIDASRDNPLLEIKAVISNSPEAYGLKRAELAHIPNFCIQHKHYSSREEFEAALINKIDSFNADWVVLAGFMRILSTHFVNHYAHRILNIHPSLLPKYPGLNTHARVLAEGDKEHGASIHLVDAGLDSGPLLAQAVLNIEPTDNEQSLQERVMVLETSLYPRVLSWLAEDRLKVSAVGIYFDDKPLPVTGIKI